MNGEKGTIVDFNEDSGRYVVQLPSGRALSLKGEKLIFPKDTCVRMTGANQPAAATEVG